MKHLTPTSDAFLLVSPPQPLHDRKTVAILSMYKNKCALYHWCQHTNGNDHKPLQTIRKWCPSTFLTHSILTLHYISDLVCTKGRFTWGLKSPVSSKSQHEGQVSDRGDFWAQSVEILVFASPIGYMLTSSGFPLLNLGIFYKFL